jgi:hypothetical protein
VLTIFTCDEGLSPSCSGDETTGVTVECE